MVKEGLGYIHKISQEMRYDFFDEKVGGYDELIKDIERYGVLEGRGKPKKLKYREEYSRRIDEEHRLIYKVQNNIIIIVSCKGHYVKERK